MSIIILILRGIPLWRPAFAKATAWQARLRNASADAQLWRDTSARQARPPVGRTRPVASVVTAVQCDFGDLEFPHDQPTTQPYQRGAGVGRGRGVGAARGNLNLPTRVVQDEPVVM